MKISLFFAWYDMWIGVYFDREGCIYICLIPMLVLLLDFNKEEQYIARGKKIISSFPPKNSLFSMKDKGGWNPPPMTPKPNVVPPPQK